MQHRFFRQILFFLAIITLHANAQPAISNSAALTRQYNHFLKELHLTKVIQADTFQYQQNLVQQQGDEVIQLNHVYQLVCKPNIAFATPFQFAAAWNKAENSFGGDQIYRMLFSQLADNNSIAPDSLAISLRFTDLFSFLIYYDHGIKIKKVIIGGRDSDVTDPGNLDDNCNGGMFLNLFAKGDLSQKLHTRLLPAFKVYKHRKAIVVTRGYSGAATPGMLALKIINVSAEVTRNPHERIFLNVFFSPSGEPGHFNVYYLFYVFYASGLAEPNAKEYRNAMPDYTDEVRDYGLKLKQLIRNALYKK